MNVSDKLAVLMEFNGYTKDELEAYLSLKFGSMTKGGMTASILSQSGYEKAKSVIFGQPQLNENQQIVLEWLKSTWIDRKKNCWFPFEVINSLYYQFDVAWGKVSYEEFKRIEKDKPYIKAYGELTALEQFEVLELFSKWALEQEEE